MGCSNGGLDTFESPKPWGLPAEAAAPSDRVSWTPKPGAPHFLGVYTGASGWCLMARVP